MSSFGVDFGTAYCCMGTCHDHDVEIIPNDMGERTAPSYVSFCTNQRLIGSPAKGYSSRNAKNTPYNIKRILGRKYNDPIVQKYLELIPVKLIKSPENAPMYQVAENTEIKTFYPEEIVSMILSYLQNVAYDYIGKKINSCVISVPANFNYYQRQSMMNAAEISGLNVLQLINSPTAVVITHAHNSDNLFIGKVIVIDFGAGKYDVSVIQIDKTIIEVIATTGNEYLGGEDIDIILVNYFAEQFQREHKIDLRVSDRAMKRLRTQCERAKRTLSAAATACIELDSLYNQIDVCWNINRNKYYKLCGKIFQPCIHYIEQALNEAETLKSEIDDVLVVGGSCRSTFFQNMIREYLNGTKITDINRTINLDEGVAYGAAIIAAQIAKQQFGEYIIRDITATPVCLVNDGVMERIIARRMKIPCKVIKQLKTKEDNQNAFTPFKVYTGNEQNTTDINLFGEFQVSGIPSTPKGSLIDVIFVIDESGILSVEVNCNNILRPIVMDGYIRSVKYFSHIPDSIKYMIINFSEFDEILSNVSPIKLNVKKVGLSQTQLDEMAGEALIWRKEEQIKRKKIYARNKLENFAYTMRNALEEDIFKSTSNSDDCQEILDSVKHTIDWVDENLNAEEEEFNAKNKQLDAIWKVFIAQILARLRDKNSSFLQEFQQIISSVDNNLQ